MYDVRDKLTISILLLVLTLTSVAQEVKVSGGFIEDGMKLGENIHYWMSVRYPAELELLLPDSNYNFSPFEFAAKNYYPSRLSGNIILDSAVYTLQSYEIDKVQYLDLPAFILKDGDTTTIRAAQDSVLFFELVKEVTDTTSLKENLAYQEVNSQFNYPLFGIILGSLVIIGIVCFLIFGKRVRRALKLRKLKKEYIRFSDRLTGHIDSLKKQPEWQTAEKAVSDWKRFLEMLEDKPYTKLTTKEIMMLEYTKELKETLRNIDRSVYGRVPNEELYKEFQAVEDFTQHRYSVITDQIKNG